MDCLRDKLRKVQLDEDYWLKVIREQVGVQSAKAFQYVAQESYRLLLHYIRWPWEKKALSKLLHVQIGTNFPEHCERQREMLVERQREMSNSLKVLQDLSNEGKVRHDNIVQHHENSFREMLQIPECIWINSEVKLIDAVVKMKDMHENIGKQCMDDHNVGEASFVVKASGCLKGVWIRGNENDILVPGDMLRVPEEVHLDFPFIAPYIEQRHFKSKIMEDEFLKEVNMLRGTLFKEGYSASGIYSSTVRYCFMPGASCFFDDHELQLSNNALSQLVHIEQEMNDHKPTDFKFESYFRQFGSHAYRGPLHVGGIFMWKCYTDGYVEAEGHIIQSLHEKVIDSVMTMQLQNCSNNFCVSELAHTLTDYTEGLINNTFLELVVTGAQPPDIVGLPDWKNCLITNNEMWHLVHRGVSKVPVWDIILKCHVKEFNNVACFVNELQKQWKQLGNAEPRANTTAVSKEIQEITDKVMNRGPASKMKEFEADLLLQIKRSVEESLLDPEAWATKVITQPGFQTFLCSNIKECLARNEDIANVKRLLQNLLEPVDVGVKTVFSTEMHLVQSIYDRCTLPLPLHREDFLRIDRYFRLVLKMMSSKPSMQVTIVNDDVSYPQNAMKGTSVIEKVVNMLRNHLVKTHQVYEECLLVTILHTLKYNNIKQRFSYLLTKMDVSFLCKNFTDISEEYFALLSKKALLNAQAYLFYITINIADEMSVGDECILSNIEYLQKKMRLFPQITAKIEVLDLEKLDWKGFKDEMKSFYLKACAIHDHEDTTKETQSRNEVLFQKLGLHEYFPQMLSLHSAREIREDTLTALYPESKSDRYKIDPVLYPFVLLQQIMAFDNRWTTANTTESCSRKSDFESYSHSESNSDSESDSDSGSDSHDNDSDHKSIHPLDTLLALLHCSDNFLRQDILSRLATCQFAVPLLLPDPITQEPTLLVKQFRKVHSDSPYCCRIITYPAPFVSFLRIGDNSRSKSEILCNIINSNNAFFHYNLPGGNRCRQLVSGLVEICWHFPSEKFVSDAIAFVNLRGDAFNSCLQKQIMFLCQVCTLHVVLLNDSMLKEDANREYTIRLLKKLSCAEQGVLILQTGSKWKVSEYFNQDHSKFSVIRLSGKMNSADITGKIQRRIREKLKESSHPLSGEDDVQKTIDAECKKSSHHIKLRDTAQKCEISIDEDAYCKKGRQFAEELFTLIDEYKDAHPKESPKELLPLQSEELWCKWAAADKEQYRQKRKDHDMTVYDYGALKRKEMEEVRWKQCQIVKELVALEEEPKETHQVTKSQKLLVQFITTMTTLHNNAIPYYMAWLKFMLDDLSRELLPHLCTQYREKRDKLCNITDADAGKKCQDELKCMSIKIINASFGLEHLLREASQAYEAVIAQTEAHFSEQEVSERLRTTVFRLPLIAATLLYEGFPIELLDGDASHLPQQWISDTLSNLSRICKTKLALSSDPIIHVLSVLGLQSTGKSTLLNTMFGAQFAVSAGRCTRGAFMQLIPVHQSLQEKCGVHFFLLIDTEGLQPPECDILEAQKHDNELAAFVIGIANLTLINIQGEVSVNMDNILETAVYAFLRMREVELKPHCHLVHQHVTATATDDNLYMGRIRIKESLDRMTKVAAKETGLEQHYEHFSDVIQLDYEKDVSFLPDMWSGTLLMANVKMEYSEEAQKLKLVVINNVSNTQSRHASSIIDLKKHIKELWNAIIKENFVFSFKNIGEISAFKVIDNQCSEWSWNMKKEMTEWEQTAEIKVMGCPIKELESVYEKITCALEEHKLSITLRYKDALEKNFYKGTEVMLKWRESTWITLWHLCMDLHCNAKNHCKKMFRSRMNRFDLEQQREKLSGKIFDQVKCLVGTHKEDKMGEERVKEVFEGEWRGWISDLTRNVENLPHNNVATEVERYIINSFPNHNKLLMDKLQSKKITEWGNCLELTLTKSHIKWHHSSLIPLVPAWNILPKRFFQHHTTQTLQAVQRYLHLKQTSTENFKPQFVTELLDLIRTETIKMGSELFAFTGEYDIDIALISCGYAIPVFERMEEAFRRKHDPLLWIEHEMKPYFRDFFVTKCNEVNKEISAAVTLCKQLEDPIKESIIKSIAF